MSMTAYLNTTDTVILISPILRGAQLQPSFKAFPIFAGLDSETRTGLALLNNAIAKSGASINAAIIHEALDVRFHHEIYIKVFLYMVKYGYYEKSDVEIDGDAPIYGQTIFPPKKAGYFPKWVDHYESNTLRSFTWADELMTKYDPSKPESYKPLSNCIGFADVSRMLAYIIYVLFYLEKRDESHIIKLTNLDLV